MMESLATYKETLRNTSNITTYDDRILIYEQVVPPFANHHLQWKSQTWTVPQINTIAYF